MNMPVELDNKECAEEMCKGQVIKDELNIDVKKRDISGPYLSWRSKALMTPHKGLTSGAQLEAETAHWCLDSTRLKILSSSLTEMFNRQEQHHGNAWVADANLGTASTNTKIYLKLHRILNKLSMKLGTFCLASFWSLLNWGFLFLAATDWGVGCLGLDVIHQHKKYKGFLKGIKSPCSEHSTVLRTILHHVNNKIRTLRLGIDVFDCYRSGPICSRHRQGKLSNQWTFLLKIISN